MDFTADGCFSGFSAVNQYRHGRIGIGSERTAAYVRIILDRIQQWRDGVLKVRPMDKPVLVYKCHCANPDKRGK